MPDMKIKPPTDGEAIPTALRIKINNDLSLAVTDVVIEVRGAVVDTVHKAVLAKIPTDVKQASSAP